MKIRMDWRSGSLMALVCVAVTGQASAEEWAHFYQKQPKPLTLDTSRIALFREGRLEAGSLAGFGLDEERKELMPIPGWTLIGTSPQTASSERIVETIRSLAVDQQIPILFASPIFVGDDGGPVIVTRDLLIGFEPGTYSAVAERILAAENAGAILDRNWGNMPGAYRLRSASRNGFEVLEAANRLAQRPEVRFAEPDMIFTGRGDLIPNDTFFADCWGIHNTGQNGGTVDADMDGPEAWDITTGAPSIIVVIIDTGVEQDHPDINQNAGNDVTSDPSATGDPVNACDNHGTAVAGCVSATINNNLGTVGIAPGCKSASVRTFISNIPCTGGWSTSASWTVDALTWAETIGARVTNNSNIYGFTSGAIEAKYNSTYVSGMVHFACAGNNGTSTLAYPSSIPVVNAVAAMERHGLRAGFSQYGVGLDFSAPGEDIESTDRTGPDGYYFEDYGPVSGTSFASPYSAGVAALMLSVNAGLSSSDVEQIMASACVDLGTGGYDTDYGWGFVNAATAVGLVDACSIPFGEAGVLADCNTNGLDDACEIANGFSQDGNGNSIPDECECVAADAPQANTVPLVCSTGGAACVPGFVNCASGTCGPGVCTVNAQCNPPGSNDGLCINGICHTPLNRYLTFFALPLPIGATAVAIRVTFTQMPGPADCIGVPDYSAFQGDMMWVGTPDATGTSRLVSAPLYRDWGAGTLVKVSDCNIVPCARYTIEVLSNSPGCGGSTFSASVTLTTPSRWGNVSGSNYSFMSPPDNGSVSFGDIGVLVDRFRNSLAIPPSEKPRCDICRNVPTQGGGTVNIDFIDIGCVVDGFKGLTYDTAIKNALGQHGPAGSGGSCTLP